MTQFQHVRPMNTIRIAGAALAAIFWLATSTAALAWQPPLGRPEGGPAAGRPDGPPPGGPPPGGPRPPHDSFGPGGRGGQNGPPHPPPPPPTPLEHRDERLRALLDEEAALREECDRLAERARGDETAIDELRAAVTRHFDLRHEIRQRKVELLEQELTALKEALAARQERKDLLVDDRVADLLGMPSPIDF